MTAFQNQLQQIPAPNLPLAPDYYLKQYGDQYSNVLRLYFNRLTGAVNSLTGPYGGQYVEMPNGLFFNLTTQTLAAANTGYPVEFDQTYLSSAVSVVDGSKLTVSVPGVYNFQYSGCVKSKNSSSKNVFLWITRSGTTIGYSTNAYTLSGSGTYGIIAWNFSIDMQAGDYIQLYWSATDANVALVTEAASAPHPGIPASVCAVLYAGPLPETLPTPP